MRTPVPPSLASTLINRGGSSIPNLIFTAVNKIRAFDKEHKDEANFVKANTHYQYLVNWLYALSIDTYIILPVLATPYIDPIILEKSKEIHDEWIHTATTITNPFTTILNNTVFQQLATNVVDQTVVLEKINNFNGIFSIYPFFKKIILAAVLEDGIDVPFVSVKHYSEFFEQKSTVHAQIHLLQTLQSELKYTVDGTAPLATALPGTAPNLQNKN